MPELYDWQADTAWPGAGTEVSRAWPVVPAKSSAELGVPRMNNVTGHAHDCACPRCPGWYEARAAAGAAPYGPYGSPVPPPRQEGATGVLLGQVVPVVCLLATVTVCGLVLVPVVVPVLAVGLTAIIVALVVLALTVVGVLAVLGRASVRRDATQGAQVIHGQVVSRRAWWRRGGV